MWLRTGIMAEDKEDDRDELATPGDAGGADSVPRYARMATEVELMDRLQRVVDRDEAALAFLYEAMAGRVYGLALRITRRAQTAEEVVEDTFWQVWRQAPRFDPERGSAAAWIMTMARSRALDALRRAGSEESLTDDADERPAEDDGPEDLVAATEAGCRVRQALQGLDPLPRQLVALAFFRGFSHEEIAVHTGLPLGTVKSHIRRALGRLKEQLLPGPAMVGL